MREERTPGTGLPDPERRYPGTVEDSACRVTNWFKEKDRSGKWIASGGSGVCVAYDKDAGEAFILSVYHVTGGDYASKLQISFPDGTAFNDGRLVATDMVNDLAVIVVRTQKPLPVVKVAETDPPEGARVIKIGYPVGPDHKTHLVIHAGTVLGRFLRDRASYCMDVWSGDSGCGIFLSDRGVVVGVVSSRSDGHYAHGACVGPIRAILDRSRERWLKRRGSDPFAKPAPQPSPERRPPAAMPPVVVAPPLPQAPAPGPRGADGAPGPAGPAGPQGPPGKDADTTALAAALAELRQEIQALKNSSAPPQAPAPATRVRIVPAQ